MSVVCQRDGSDEIFVYCKGSPEVITSLSNPSSVPNDFATILEAYTFEGYRVIGLGWKKIKDIPSKDINFLTRNSIEANLQFLGLLMMENKIKPETFETVQVLRNGKFKLVMLTGDNINTAMSVALDSKIIASHEDFIEIYIKDNEIKWTVKRKGARRLEIRENFVNEEIKDSVGYKLALTGDAWEHIKKYHYHLIPNVLTNAAVFAKMTSKQKLQVVTYLQNIGHSVIMCGDGANDCGAVRSANAGVSFSDEEASIASPFTSVKSNISCVPLIIKEGRAGLVSSCGLVKFLLTSSWIEFLWTCFNIYFISFPPISQYIYIDVFIVIHLSLYFGLTSPYKGQLVSETPISSLNSVIPITSMLVHCFIMTTFQILSLYILSTFSWSHSTDEIYFQCFALYSIIIFQFIIAALTFSQDNPYIEPWYTNTLYLFGIITIVTLSLCWVFYSADWIVELFQFVQVPPSITYKLISIGLTVLNLALCIIIEKLLIERILLEKYREQNQRGKSKYRSIEENTFNTEWLDDLTKPIKHVALSINSQGYDNEAFNRDPKQDRI